MKKRKKKEQGQKELFQESPNIKVPSQADGFHFFFFSLLLLSSSLLLLLRPTSSTETVSFYSNYKIYPSKLNCSHHLIFLVELSVVLFIRHYNSVSSGRVQIFYESRPQCIFFYSAFQLYNSLVENN